MEGDIDAGDLKWRLDADFVKATVSLSKCLYSIQIFNENKAEVDSLFERLVSLTEVNSLMTRLTGLAASRAAAQKTSNELLLELENKQQELEIRFAGLVKAVEKALALKTQHADSVSSREPSGKGGGGSSSSTEENRSSNIGGQPLKLPYSPMSATSEAQTANAPAQTAVQLRCVLAEIDGRATQPADWGEHLLREVERIIGFKCEGGPWFGSLRTTPPLVHTIPNSSLLLQTHEQNILRRCAGFQGGVVGSPLGGM